MPVDPQRVFVRWHVGERALAEASGKAGRGRLVLRFLRPGADEASPDTGQVIGEYPAASNWHEGFYSLGQSGGPVRAGLGVAGAGNGFKLLTLSDSVTLPEPIDTLVEPPLEPLRATVTPIAAVAGEPPAPPAAPSPAPRETRDESSAQSASADTVPPRAAMPPPAPEHVLDEGGIVMTAAQMGGLPPELYQLPGSEGAAVNGSNPTAGDDASWAEDFVPPPETPALGEKGVVVSVLQQTAASERIPDDLQEVPGGGRVAPRPPPESSQRLASMVTRTDAETAPISIEATLVLSGRLEPGQRLRLGGSEIKPRRGGRFTCRQPLRTFTAAWQLLNEVMATDATGDAPELELLARTPATRARLVMHASVELEGVVRDASYVKHLPAGVAVDDAGRFRVVRPLPAGAVLLPDLVMVAEPQRARR